MSGRKSHIAERSCVACRCKRPKDTFLRLVRLESREVIIDASGHADGRGAYICRSAECLEKARRKRAFARALMVDEGNIPYETLKSAVEQCDPDIG